MLAIVEMVTATTSMGVPSRAGGAGTTAGRFYYGHTSKGVGALLFVRGDVLVGWSELSAPRSRIEGRLVNTCPEGRRCAKQTRLTGIVPVNPHLSIRLQGDKLSFHLLFHHGEQEEWLDARRTAGGRAITGWTRYRDHFPGYGPSESGKISFTTRLWAASAGASWAGKTADGQPLRMSIGYKLVPGSIVNGRRSLRPVFTVAVPETPRRLVCRSVDGVETTLRVSLPALSGELVQVGGWPQRARLDLYPTAWRLRTNGPARGSAATPDGVSIEAELSIERIEWRSSGLAATGSLSYRATPASGGSLSTCAAVRTDFTMHPQ
jgi:hypothetical protein